MKREDQYLSRGLLSVAEAAERAAYAMRSLDVAAGYARLSITNGLYPAYMRNAFAGRRSWVRDRTFRQRKPRLHKPHWKRRR